MAVVQASDLKKDMSGTPLWRGLSFKLEPRDRMTIAGRNGAGKTTLLRILAGDAGHDGGDVSFQKGCRVALHDQRPPRERDVTLRDYVVSGRQDLVELEQRLRDYEQRMADGDMGVFDAYAEAQATLESSGGYRWRDEAADVLKGLGFDDDALDRQLSTFSGGQLTRASLARALAAKPDLLLLDEPTNHLDLESLEWLEKTLVSLDAAIVLVAHDRWFLEAVGTSVLEIEAGRGRFFAGTWANWRKEQAAREMALGKAIEKQQAEIARMEAFVERFRYKATKARQAQSRLKQLDKMDRIERGPKDTRELGIRFKKVERSGRVIWELEDGRVEVGDPADPEDHKVLLEGAELWLERGEHVCLVGPNGVGKTTLVQTLAGERKLAAGKIRTGHNVQVGYLSQHGEELEFGGARTVLEACQHQTGFTPNEARSLLGRFLFTGEQAEKELEGLSGGERKRLGLAILVAGGSNVLILDEPTNHLDIESREALEDALQAYEGSIILVSHDRALLEVIGTRFVAVEDRELHSTLGGWQEYVEASEARREEAAVGAAAKGSGGGSKATGTAAGAGAGPKGATTAGTGPGGGARNGAPRSAGASAASRTGGRGGGTAAPAGGTTGSGGRAAKGGRRAAATAAKGASGNGKAAASGGGAQAHALSKNKRRELERVEQRIEEAERVLAALEEELAGPEAWATPAAVADSTKRHDAAKGDVEDLYRKLERLSG